MQLSVSSTALDLAMLENSLPHVEQNPWGSSTFQRSHRPAQHSLPVNNFPYTPNSNSSPKVVPGSDSPAAIRRFDRGPTDFPFAAFSENLNGKMTQPETGHGRHASVPKLQPSYSTSDIPTMRNPGSMQNANFGRGPIDRQRHGRDPSLGGGDRSMAVCASLTRNSSGILIVSQGGMFGPPLSAGLGSMPMVTPGMSPLPSPGLYGGYGHINMNAPVFHPGAYGGYSVYGQPQKVNEPMQQPHGMQARNMQKRPNDGEVNRFANVKLESLVNEIYSLCKDQHGCRYLQKKLEEQNPAYVEMIFRETHPHVVELMTGMTRFLVVV